MIEIYKQKSGRELKEKIQSLISNYKKNPTILRDSIGLKDEFVGDVKGDEFWIQKTRPRIFRGPSRAFYGKIIEQKSNVKIVGKFKFLKMYSLVNNVLHIGVSILLCWQFISSVLNLKQFVFAFCILNIFIEVLFRLNIFCYRREEKEVINFLYNL